jgi:hypothetical protein
MMKPRKMRYSGHVARMRERREMHTGVWSDSQKEMDGWMDNIKMDLGKIEWSGMD